MLDSLRAFALDRLTLRPGEGGAARARLAGWNAAYCEANETQHRSVDPQTARDRLRAELPNLRAALEWSFASGDPTIGVRIACSMVWFWGWIGANEEANRWLHRALDTTGLDDQRRARLLEGVAMNAFAVGDLAAGQGAAQEAARLWGDAGLPQRSFAELIYRGLSERWRGGLDSAAATHDRAIAIARETRDDWGLAVALYWRAATAADKHDNSLAVILLDEALALAETAGDRRAVGSILHQLGRIALRSGDADRALDLGRQALAIHEAIGWNEGVGAALDAVGRALVGQGRPVEAQAAHRRSLRVAAELGKPRTVTKAIEGLAGALAASGDPEAAAEVLGSAAALRSRSGVPVNASQRRVADDLEARVRDRLGDDTFETAFVRGQALAPSDLMAGRDGPREVRRR
jgi:tetratricopeptide (TPR) repeat protein